MKKLLLGSLLALSVFALLPERSFAWGTSNPYSQHGYGFLGSLAMNHMTWIHSDGPLFNYGPYYGQGHVNMHIPQPRHGSYYPADMSLYGAAYSGYSGYGAGYGAPPQGYAGGQPTNMPAAATPSTIPPAAAVPTAPTTPVSRGLFRPRVQQAGYKSVYPDWLIGR
mgnify:CR=1 FL=1